MKRLIAVLMLLIAGEQISDASTIVVDERFSDGGWTDGADPLDMSWFKSRQDMEVTVFTDSIIAGGNALHVDTVSVAGMPRSNFIVGTFDALALGPRIGDKITFSFDFHFTGTVPADSGSNLRFGVFSSAGTPIASDVYADGQDDPGYAVGFEASRSLFAGVIKRWVGTDIGGPDGIILPTTTSGSPGDLSDTSTKHTAEITVQRLTNTSNMIRLEMGGLQATAIDAAPDRFENFSEIVIRGSYKKTLDFAVDNVRVAVHSVPEPVRARHLVATRCHFRLDCAGYQTESALDMVRRFFACTTTPTRRRAQKLIRVSITFQSSRMPCHSTCSP